MGNIFLKKKMAHLDEQKPKVRHVVPNHLVPLDMDPLEHPNRKFLTNRIKTTKYTIWSFLPKNLFEQFHRFANLYFLFIVLLNWVPQVNAFGKEVAMIPVIFVLAVTAIKDGFEDFRRNKADKEVNIQKCRLYARSERRYIQREWRDITVGDIVHLSCNEVIPADMVLLRTSEASRICYIDTTNIDGENNLKQRQATHGLHQGEEFHPTLFTHTIECELPNIEINKFHGVMLTPLNEKIPINKHNILLRGCILRNTDFVEGIVVYAGHDTKALLNNRGPRYKRSKVERQINRDVVWCVILLILMCFFSALGTGIWNALYDDSVLVPFIPYESLSLYSAPYQGFIRFWTYVILYQVVIPLSLYVTIELVKIGQVYFISQDARLYHAATDTRAECRALNITEDLGQVGVVFSDKTGTLTENAMVFRSCAVGGVHYAHGQHDGATSPAPGVSTPPVASTQVTDDSYVRLSFGGTERRPNAVSGDALTPDPVLQQVVTSMTFTDVPVDVSAQERRVWEFFLLLAVCNTVVVSLHGHQDKMDPSGFVREDSVSETSPSPLPPELGTSRERGSITRDLSHPGPITRDPSRPGSVTKDPSQGRGSVRSLLHKHRRKLRGILSPRTRSPLTTRQRLENEGSSSGDEEDDRDATDTDTSLLSENTLRTKYEAESPDELALVQAACSYGCRLLHHTPGSATLWLPREGEVSVRVLHTLHFDPERKRMSVIVQHPASGDLVLYCKGADSAILPHLRDSIANDEQSLNILKQTEWCLTQYAKEGLRTLCMAKKELSYKEYESWLRLHVEAESALDHRDRKLHDSACRIEAGMDLLGVTGIEDRLQPGVPATIASLQAAGINVWVLTGDKQETAINIAHSCQLISFDQEIIFLNAKNKQAARALLESKVEYLDILAERARGSEVSAGSEVKQIPEIALVVDGKTFGYIEQEKACRDNFLRVAQQCGAVLCCRATPAQKALMVKLVQEKLKKLTLAIGDGANDVSMIQTADIGVGISGREGMQAVMASDFSLPRFCFLRRLLLVHGHWCYDRLARMTLYMFFKNTVFVVLLMWFQLYSGFSGGGLTDDINLILFNLVYTSLPPIIFGVFDKDVPADILLAKPWLYKDGQQGKAYRRHSYFICVLDAIWQSLVQFYIPYLAYTDSATGLWEFGLTCVAGCVFSTLLHLCIETRCWNIFHVAVMAASLLLFFGVNLVYSVVVRTGSPPANPYGVYERTMAEPLFWVTCLITVIVALAPRFILRALAGTFYPDITVLSRQALSSSEQRVPDTHPSGGASGLFATWASANTRSRDFEQLREEEVDRTLSAHARA